MSLNDPTTNFKVVSCTNPIVIAAAGATNGASIDTLGFRWATFIIHVGVQAGATTTGTTCIIQEDTATGFASPTAVTGAAFTAATLLAGATVLAGRVDCLKTEQFLRTVFTTVGAAVSVPVSAVCILSESEDTTIYQTVAFDFTV